MLRVDSVAAVSDLSITEIIMTHSHNGNPLVTDLVLAWSDTTLAPGS